MDARVELSSSTRVGSEAHLRSPTPTDPTYLQTPSRTHPPTLHVPVSPSGILRRLSIHSRRADAAADEVDTTSEKEEAADSAAAAAAETPEEILEKGIHCWLAGKRGRCWFRFERRQQDEEELEEEGDGRQVEIEKLEGEAKGSSSLFRSL